MGIYFRLTHHARLCTRAPNFRPESSKQVFAAGGVAGVLTLHKYGMLFFLSFAFMHFLTNTTLYHTVSEMLTCSYTAGWWNGPRSETIDSGEGQIVCIRWRGPLLAWANDVHVKLCDAARPLALNAIERDLLRPKVRVCDVCVRVHVSAGAYVPLSVCLFCFCFSFSLFFIRFCAW